MPRSARATCGRSSTRSSCRTSPAIGSSSGYPPDAVPAEVRGRARPGRRRGAQDVRASRRHADLPWRSRAAWRSPRSSCRFAISRARPTTGSSCPARSCGSTSIRYAAARPTAWSRSTACVLRVQLGVRGGRRRRDRRRPYGDPVRSRGHRTVARYGDKDLLLSGWLEGEEMIAGRAAVVQATVGPGRVVLFGFPVQHRGQSHATFRLLFNAILSAR